MQKLLLSCLVAAAHADVDTLVVNVYGNSECTGSPMMTMENSPATSSCLRDPGSSNYMRYTCESTGSATYNFYSDTMCQTSTGDSTGSVSTDVCGNSMKVTCTDSSSNSGCDTNDPTSYCYTNTEEVSKSLGDAYNAAVGLGTGILVAVIVIPIIGLILLIICIVCCCKHCNKGQKA